MKKTFIALFTVVALLVAIFLWTGVFPLFAQGDPGILWRINKLLENQAEILKRLGQISSDLDSVKSKL